MRKDIDGLDTNKTLHISKYSVTTTKEGKGDESKTNSNRTPTERRFYPLLSLWRRSVLNLVYTHKNNLHPQQYHRLHTGKVTNAAFLGMVFYSSSVLILY